MNIAKITQKCRICHVCVVKVNINAIFLTVANIGTHYCRFMLNSDAIVVTLTHIAARWCCVVKRLNVRSNEVLSAIFMRIDQKRN